jgi:hypothetical protein
MHREDSIGKSIEFRSKKVEMQNPRLNRIQSQVYASIRKLQVVANYSPFTPIDRKMKSL